MATTFFRLPNTVFQHVISCHVVLIVVDFGYLNVSN